MKRKRAAAAVLAAVGMLALYSLPVLAVEPSRSYTYNEEKEAVPSPNGFQVQQVIYGKDLPCLSFSNAQDLFVDSDGNLYLLDSGNARVLLLDQYFAFVKELSAFRWQGEELTLSPGAEGIVYQEATGLLYIADTASDRIVVSDLEGTVRDVYEKPVSSLLEEGVPFAPKKLIVDNTGMLYVLSKNVNTGALLIDQDHRFLGFYGTNDVKETLTVRMERLWRGIMTEEQRKQSEYSFQPMEFNNLFWSKDRFVYAVSQQNQYLETEVSKLNATGENILEVMPYGELTRRDDLPVAFADITVDEDGFFTIVDRNNGKLYQYDKSSNLLAVSGGIGQQEGLFSSPSAVGTNSRGELIVLDAKKNCLVVLEPTLYGEMIRESVKLYNQGLYLESIESWKEVLRMNFNFSLAYVGLGKAEMQQGNYAQAMSYFQKGGDQENYSAAKSALRDQRLEDHFGLVLLLAATAVVAVLFCESIGRFFRWLLAALSALPARLSGGLSARKRRGAQ